MTVLIRFVSAFAIEVVTKITNIGSFRNLYRTLAPISTFISTCRVKNLSTCPSPPILRHEILFYTGFHSRGMVLNNFVDIPGTIYFPFSSHLFPLFFLKNSAKWVVSTTKPQKQYFVFRRELISLYVSSPSVMKINTHALPLYKAEQI